jgi:hypothetical protein
MRRRLAAMAAALAVMLTVFVVAAPSAFAYRDTGWHDTTCTVPGGTITSDIRVVWYAADNHRFWMAWAYAKDRAGQFHPVDAERWWVRSVTGVWVLIREQIRPDPGESWWTVYTPRLRPGQGHYFKNVATWNGGICQSQIVLN